MVEQGYYLKFRIWFIKGGIGTFVPALFNMLDSIRKDQQMNVINSVITGMFSERTYIDPNDPSVLYHQQPEIYHTTRTNLPQRSKAPANIVVSQEKINRQFPQGEIRYPSLQEINNPQGQNVNRDYNTYSSGAYNYSPYGKNSSN